MMTSKPSLHLGPAEVAVADAALDVVVAERREDAVHGVAQRLDDLDRVRALHDARQDGALEAAAGADLQRHLARLGLADLRHVGLAEVVRQRRAVAERPGLGVGLVGDAGLGAAVGVLVVEVLARHGGEGAQHGRVGGAEALLQVALDALQVGGAAGLDGGELRLALVHRAAGAAHGLREARGGPALGRPRHRGGRPCPRGAQQRHRERRPRHGTQHGATARSGPGHVTRPGRTPRRGDGGRAPRRDGGRALRATAATPGTPDAGPCGPEEAAGAPTGTPAGGLS